MLFNAMSPSTRGGSPVMPSYRLIFAVGLAASLAAPAFAQQSDYFFETKPMFDNCADGSLDRAIKNGITLGFSQIPPEEIYDQNTKKISGIDWDVNRAVADWLGVK